MKIEELLDSIVKVGTIPNGTELLQQAVRRLASPITVEILFPDPNVPLRYIPITKMAKESGGERLTSAVLLYCTLTQLRAIERTKHTDASTSLVLDNPLGTASRPIFLELQREVAKAMNIQLIYTTGIQDFEAIRTLPNIVQLRNDYIDKRYCLLGGSERGLAAAEQTDHIRWNAHIRNRQFICLANVAQRSLIGTIQVDNLPFELSSNA